MEDPFCVPIAFSLEVFKITKHMLLIFPSTEGT